MKMRLLVLTSLITTAGLVDSAMAMKRKYEEIEETSENNKNKKLKFNKIDVIQLGKELNHVIQNTPVEKKTPFKKNDYEIKLISSSKKIIDLKTLEKNLEKELPFNHDTFEKVVTSFNHTKHATRLLTKNEATTVSNYIQNWLTTYFTLKKIAKAANSFEIELAYIKNLHFRRIFAKELVKHLRSIITVSTAATVANQFDDIKEGLAKWAIRFIYNEVMTGTNTPLIDNMGVVSQINNAIAQEWTRIVQESDIWVCTLDLGHLNNRQQLENFLLQAHEILEPLLGCDITRLSLYENSLTQVPDFNLPNLQYLNLFYNELTQVPNFNLPNLKWLSLTNNQLTQVPNFNLPYLQYLNLDFNQLTQVPNFNLPYLQYLNLDFNQLTQVPNFNLPYLQSLSLYNNQLNPRPVFTNLPNNCDVIY